MTRVSAITVSIVLFVIPEAFAGETVAPVFESMAGVMDASYEIEKYALQHARLPSVKSPAELSQALLGSDSMTEFLVDAWGTPLHIASSPVSNSYVVASAGADRQFDRESWTVREATRSAADDIVVRDGEMVRWPEEWALGRFRAEGGDEVSALRESLATSKAARTQADMRLICTSLEQYAMEHGSLPAALPPELPTTDAWGHPFAVMIDVSAKTYRIVSAGADGAFDEKRWSETDQTLDYARDAVLQNCELTASWQIGAPGRTLGEAYAALTVFESKLASLRLLGDDERRKLRLEGLAKDMDAAAQRQDFFDAMNLYQEAEKLGVRDTERP
jgi:hypothetical protein